MFKVLVLLLFAGVVASLASALFYLNRDQGDTRRTVRALTVRISLSLLLFILLLVGYLAGWIQPHGLAGR